MVVYLYDQEGVFIGEHVCQKSPLEKKVFLKPTNCTDQKPPQVDGEHSAVFKNGAWLAEINKRRVRKFLTSSGVVAACVPPEDAFAHIADGENEDDADVFDLASPGIFGLPVAFVSASKKAAKETKKMRDAKIAELRSARDCKLSDVDVMINDFVLGESSYTTEELKKYRKALRDVTEPYKKFDTNARQAEALDALVLADFVWPKVGV